MHVISKKTLQHFWSRFPKSETPLRSWLRIAERAEWENFADVREVYPSADLVGKYIVFNIGGNKYRLIVVIHFNRGKIYVRDVLTHEEYDQEAWKKD